MSLNAEKNIDFAKIGTDDAFRELGSSREGLTTTEASNRIANEGYNDISEKKVNPVKKFLLYLFLNILVIQLYQHLSHRI